MTDDEALAEAQKRWGPLAWARRRTHSATSDVMWSDETGLPTFDDHDVGLVDEQQNSLLLGSGQTWEDALANATNKRGPPCTAPTVLELIARLQPHQAVVKLVVDPSGAIVCVEVLNCLRWVGIIGDVDQFQPDPDEAMARCVLSQQRKLVKLEMGT